MNRERLTREEVVMGFQIHLQVKYRSIFTRTAVCSVSIWLKLYTAVKEILYALHRKEIFISDSLEILKCISFRMWGLKWTVSLHLYVNPALIIYLT